MDSFVLVVLVKLKTIHSRFHKYIDFGVCIYLLLNAYMYLCRDIEQYSRDVIRFDAFILTHLFKQTLS